MEAWRPNPYPFSSCDDTTYQIHGSNRSSSSLFSWAYHVDLCKKAMPTESMAEEGSILPSSAGGNNHGFKSGAIPTSLSSSPRL